MIERVTACLENGGKHVLRRISNQHTHRSLHSAFWSHGAGNINLPSWWLAFLQVPDSRDQTWSFNKCATATSRTSTDGFGFLSFLYPGETLAFIRKCMRGNVSAVRRRRRSQLLLQRSRTYASAADTTIDIQPGQKRTPQTLGIERFAGLDDKIDQPDRETEWEPVRNLQRMLRTDGHAVTTQVLWQKYNETKNLSLKLLPKDYTVLLQRLSASKTAFDLECSRILLGDIPQDIRNHLHYRYAILAALEQEDLQGAMSLYREAAPRFDFFDGSSLILKYAIQHSSWKYALEIWKHHLDRKRVDVRQPDIWKDVNAVPISELMGIARRAGLNALRQAQTNTPDNADIMRSLAISLMKRALATRNVEFDLPSQYRMLSISCRVQQPDPSLFKAAVLQNLSLGQSNSRHNGLALRQYDEFKGKRKFVPDAELLMAMLHRFSALRDLQGIYDVLEDFRKHHEGPTEEAYSVMMPQLARHGDVTTVEGLFRDFVERYGKGGIQKHARNLFHVCFRRADADKADSILRSLQEDYGYEPDLQNWNTLIATHARVGDHGGAMALLEKLIAANITPGNSTYGILMSMYAKTSDYETASALYERAVSTGIKPNVSMVDSLVLALVASDRFDEAYQIVQEALTMDFDNPPDEQRYTDGEVTRTRMWNTLLSHCAMNKGIDKVAELQKRMHEAGVPFDTITYAALMLSLCLKKMPGSALRIKNVIMRSSEVRPTALHYSILMGGFRQNNEPAKVLLLANEMLKDNINPTFSTQNQLLRTAGKIDEQQDDQENTGDHSFQARRAEEVMKQVIETLNPMQLAPLGPMGAQSNPVNVAMYSGYYAYMIYLYGKNRSFDRVVGLYDEYIATASKVHGDAEVMPPVELLSALMVTHVNAGEHAETEKCWRLAMDKSEKIARRADTATTQAGWVLHKYRFILSLPLTRYMQSLHANSRIDEIATTVDNLRHAGYRLSVHNWNKYSQILAQAGRSLHAFEICEKHLMDGWPGWERFGSPIRAKHKIKKQWNPKSLDRDRPFPHYETLVYLAGIYLDLRSMPYGTGRDRVQELERLAPRTLEAVLKMPNFDDGVQNSVLRRGSSHAQWTPFLQYDSLLDPVFNKMQMGTQPKRTLNSQK
ncbi:MAG: hypothetical protein Q9169_000945 [Polycauliona sp. 2 TL-2023]